MWSIFSAPFNSHFSYIRYIQYFGLNICWPFNDQSVTYFQQFTAHPGQQFFPVSSKYDKNEI